MQLAYLGRLRGADAPDAVECHVADRDFARPDLKPVSIRLLVDKARPSGLETALARIAERARSPRTAYSRSRPRPPTQ
ncbi:hypothetical protein [Mangrovicoccus sp. HB161399]|uniref:hypothetical protein n=1 Tax=Mangrovicoccus sp. HB161399 TaxID=2720392 RepID=UPI001557FDA2|nr:hypothetical protein [Mangrovicoccus sp. HB161399]